MKYPKVSIIIPVRRYNDKLDECLKYCKKLGLKINAKRGIFYSP